MKIKTSELTGAALDWAVAVSDCQQVMSRQTPKRLLLANGDNWEALYAPSTDWSQGGPIIERERISITLKHHGWWAACIYNVNDEPQYGQIASTTLIAAMRCFVASRLGDEVDVPEELL